MKFAAFAGLLSLATVQAVALPVADPEPVPQTTPKGGYPTIKTIKPKYNKEAKRVILRYAPFTLKALGTAGRGSMDQNGQAGSFKVGEGMCTKCTLLSAHYRLVHPNGTEATPKEGVYIHHMTSYLSPKVVVNPIGQSLSMGNSAYFIDRGEDSGQTDTVFTSADGKFKSGYHINGKPSIRVSYDFVNYEKKARQLHLELEYEYYDGIVGKDAGHTLKTVTGSPKLNGVSTSLPMTVSRDTTIMWARGHLHSGGVSMTLKVNKAIKCVSEPKYDTAGVITSMSLCPKAIALKKGDSVVIESRYDTKQHKLREASDGSGHGAHGKLGADVMGMIAMSYTT